MRHFTRLPVRWVPVALVARPFMRTVGTLKCRNETISGLFPTVGTCCQTGPREVTFPLRPGTVVLTKKWNTMGRLPAAGRILCPSGQGTARPGPEFARGTGLARGSCGLRGASVWEAAGPSHTSTVALVARPRGGGTFATWQWSKPEMVMMMGTATAWKTLGKQ